ncbi:MAG: universal stress protein [Bacteroidales bacterium]|nr:universal stress protein [Bacteroidales bacterium]MCB8998726.1 universal stress protein [Bacteroidales bacterium]
MENLNKPIIVPWDFTERAQNAFEHAVNLSNILKRDIILLHIVENSNDIESSFEKLKQKTQELKKNFMVNSHPVVKTGNIFETIKEVSLEYKAEMVVMGTHGIKGIQKFIGSRALKVIANSKMPFVVIQDKPKSSKFDKIVFPVDFRTENKEKVSYINYLSGHFNAKFLLFKRKVEDKGFKKKIASNLQYAETFLKNNNVSYEIFTAKGDISFEKETVRFSKEQGADMILVLTTRDINLMDYLFGAKEQYVIANPEKIPVMCINPKPAKIASGFRATGG